MLIVMRLPILSLAGFGQRFEFKPLPGTAA